MKCKTGQGTDNADTCEYTADFKTLSSMEKRFIYETAEKLTKIQSENIALLAIVPVTQNEKGVV